MNADVPDAVLDAWDLRGASRTAIASGWINRTLLVERGEERLVLQRLHPVFDGAVNRDIDAITRHLERAGVLCPRIVPTRDGSLFVDAEDGTWRALTFIDGETHDILRPPTRARSAGALAGRFHRALADVEHEFVFTRLGVHDTAAHLRRLREARRLDAPDRAPVDRLTDSILGWDLPELPALPTRIVHGDLKATNLLFEGDEARAVIDLDTLAHGTIAVDMGDALRSWCNVAGESARAAALDRPTFEAAIKGYVESVRGWAEPAELMAIVPATERIAVELAARFATDFYEDRYFGYDTSRYPSRRAHNAARAAAQVALARSIRTQREELEGFVARLLE